MKISIIVNANRCPRWMDGSTISAEFDTFASRALDVNRQQTNVEENRRKLLSRHLNSVKNKRTS